MPSALSSAAPRSRRSVCIYSCHWHQPSQVLCVSPAELQAGERERWCISVTPHLQWRAALYTGEAKGTNNHSEVSSNLHTWAGSPVNEFLCATTCLIINLFLPKTEKHSSLPGQPSYYSIKEERRRIGNGNSYLWLLLPSTDVFPLGILALHGALSPWFLGFLGGNSPAAVNDMAGGSPGCFLRPAGRI